MRAAPQPCDQGPCPGQAGAPQPPCAPSALAGVESLSLGPVKKSHWRWSSGPSAQTSLGGQWAWAGEQQKAPLAGAQRHRPAWPGPPGTDGKCHRPPRAPEQGRAAWDVCPLLGVGQRDRSPPSLPPPRASAYFQLLLQKFSGAREASPGGRFLWGEPQPRGDPATPAPRRGPPAPALLLQKLGEATPNHTWDPKAGGVWARRSRQSQVGFAVLV